MSHLFLPSDPALKRLAARIEEERNHALVAAPEGEAVVAVEAGERGEAGEAGEAFRALWSSARRDDDVLQTTAPGNALQLFADAAPPPSPALAAFGGATSTATVPSRPAQETAYEHRERLREERRALVSAISHTGEEHRAATRA